MWLQNILVFIIYLESRAFGNILSEEKYRIMSAWLHFWHGIRNIVKINLVLNNWTFWRYNILVCSKKYLLALFCMAKINKHWCLHFAKCKVHIYFVMDKCKLWNLMWTSTGIISFQAETCYKRSVLNKMQTSCINGTKTLCILNKTLFN